MHAEPLQPKVESKIVSITLLSPFQIKNKLILEAANGWVLRALGTNFAFLQRDAGAPVLDIAYYVESITLSLPHQIKDCLQAHGEDGWALGGIGSSFAFFQRARNLPPVQRDFDMESITVKGIERIHKMIHRRGEEGWSLCAMGRNFAFFEKLRNDENGGWDHKSIVSKLLSITLKTPGQIQETLEREGAEGWQLCGIGASFMFLRRRRIAAVA